MPAKLSAKRTRAQCWLARGRTKRERGKAMAAPVGVSGPCRGVRSLRSYSLSARALERTRRGATMQRARVAWQPACSFWICPSCPCPSRAKPVPDLRACVQPARRWTTSSLTKQLEVLAGETRVARQRVEEAVQAEHRQRQQRGRYQVACSSARTHARPRGIAVTRAQVQPAASATDVKNP